MDELTVKKKMVLLQEKMDHFAKLLDEIDPEKAGIKEIDHIIAMLDEIEKKCKEFRQGE